jgi:hypothetical protein
VTPLTATTPATILPTTNRVTRIPTQRLESHRNTPQPLTLGQPRCTESLSGGVRCVGLIRNPLSSTIEGIALQVFLVNTNGETLAQTQTAAARLSIRPGEISPYDALFPPSTVREDWLTDGKVTAVASLVSAKVSTHRNSPYISLKADVLETRSGSVRIGVFNPLTRTVSQGVVTVMVFDPLTDTLLTYRQFALTRPISAGATLEINAFLGSEALRDTRLILIADGW